MQWALLFAEPKMLEDGAVGVEEKTEIFDATDFDTAKMHMEVVMQAGGIVTDGRCYNRIFLRLTSKVITVSAQEVVKAFERYKRYHPGPTPYDKLTPFQKRMQSGGA